jgi:hypothetical protein
MDFFWRSVYLRGESILRCGPSDTGPASEDAYSSNSLMGSLNRRAAWKILAQHKLVCDQG